MLKNIIRSKIVRFYFFFGFFPYLFLLIVSKLIDIDFSDWRMYLLFVFAINVLSTGYYTFGISFDYYTLLNLQNSKKFKKINIYIYKQLAILAITTLLGYLFYGLFFSHSILKLMTNNYLLILFMNSLFCLPIILFFSIISFRRIDLFDNKFIILSQSSSTFISLIVQVVFSLLFYYSNINNKPLYALCLIIIIYITFIFSMDYLSKKLIKKIQYEYIRN